MLSIDHLNRHVSNVDAFISFYHDVLGYTLLARGIKGSGMAYAILQGNGHELFISEKDGFLPENEHNFRHIGYAAEDADRLLADLKAKGYVEKEKQIIVKPYSGSFISLIRTDLKST